MKKTTNFKKLQIPRNRFQKTADFKKQQISKTTDFKNHRFQHLISKHNRSVFFWDLSFFENYFFFSFVVVFEMCCFLKCDIFEICCFSNLLFLVICFCPFFKYLKSRLFAFAGGSPPAPPATPRGAGLSARRLWKIRTHQNVEVYGRSEEETPRKCILQAENIMPGSKKNSEKNICFPQKKLFFSIRSKKQPFFPLETKVRLRVFLSLA